MDLREKIAIAMRKKWHEIDPEPDKNPKLTPWQDSDKRDIWLQLADVALTIAGEPDAER